MVGNNGVRVALWLVLLAVILGGCTASEPDTRMGAGMTPMYDPNDPAYRVVTGQVMAIDTDMGTQGGLTVLLRGAQPAWDRAAAKVRTIEANWTDVRMELERRAIVKPAIRITSQKFDWYFNVLNGAIRNRDRATAAEAFTELQAAWDQAKGVLREVEVDYTKFVTRLAALVFLLLIFSEGLLFLAKRLDRRLLNRRQPAAASRSPRIAGASPEADEQAAAALPSTYSFDFLSIGWVRAFAKSRYVPLVFQVLMAITFVYAIYGAVVGMEMRESNFGVLLFWSVFWPSLIMISLVTVGKMWCAICPLGALNAAASRLGLQKRFPAKLQSGIIAFILYTGVVWLIREPFGVSEESLPTAWFFSLFAVAAVAVGLVYRERTFCRSICPIGIISGLWAMLSFVELRGNPARCANCRTYECVRGNGQVRGCPMSLHPGRMESNRDCVYCLNCVKACPYDSPRIRLRWPGAELVRGSRRYLVDAFFALWVVVVLNIKENMEHYYTPPFLVSATTWVQNLFGTSNRQGVWFYVVVVFAFALLLGAYSLSTWYAARTLKWDFRRSFATFGYAFVPVVFVTIGGHSLNAIFTMFGGAAVSILAAPFGFYFYADPSIISPPAAKFVGDGFMRPVLYAIGFAGMAILPYKIAAAGQPNLRKAVRVAAPYTVIALAVANFFIWSHMALTGGGWRW